MTTIEFTIEFRHIDHPTALGSLDLEQLASRLAVVLLASQAGGFSGERSRRRAGVRWMCSSGLWQIGQIGWRDGVIGVFGVLVGVTVVVVVRALFL